MSFTPKKRLLVPILILFAVSLVVRFWFLPNANINFGFDQARDAFAVKEILNGDPKIQGPVTNSIPGLNQGVLFYYLVAPAYHLGNGNPVYATYFLAFLNALTVFAVYYLTLLLTKKILPSFVSAILFAFSFDALVFSSFLSNVSPAILFIPLMLVGLLLWIRGNKIGPLITGLFFGLTVQTEVAFGFYLLPIIYWIFRYKRVVTKQQIVFALIAFIFTVSSMILCEIKFSFSGVKGIAYMLSSKNALAHGQEFGEFIINFLTQSGTRIANLIFPFNVALGALVGYAIIAYSLFKRRVKSDLFNWPLFLSSFIFASLPALPFGGSTSPYIMIGLLPLMAVFVSIFLWEKISNIKLYVLIVIVISLLGVTKYVLKNNSEDPDYFTKNYLISKQIQVVDYTYQKAEGKPFSISTLTMPLYVNTLWSYMYNWYGMEKYGYLPSFRGRDQIDLPGNNLQKADDSTKTHFFIVEPTFGISEQWIIYAYGDQDAVSKIIEETNFGDIVVQQRIIY